MIKATDLFEAAGFDVDITPGYGPLITKEIFRGRKSLGVVVIAGPTGDAIHEDQDASVPVVAQFYPGDDWENAEVGRMVTYGGEDEGMPAVPLLLLVAARLPEFADCTPMGLFV